MIANHVYYTLGNVTIISEVTAWCEFTWDLPVWKQWHPVCLQEDIGPCHKQNSALILHFM